MAVVGLFLGLKGQGVQFEVREVFTPTIWAAAIGYGFGSIFDQRRPGRALVIYWAATLALVAAFFGPLLRIASFPVQEALAGMIGALVGELIGTIHLRFARRRSDALGSGASA